MGNRAVITLAKYDDKGKLLKVVDDNELGVYVHWNGGYDSVNAFLHYCKLKEYRTPETDNYGWARLCQVIGNYLGGNDSIGIDLCKNLDCDNGDNGVYLIKDWKIVGRVYNGYSEQHSYDLETMLINIDNAMPKKEQLGVTFIKTYIKRINASGD